MRDDVGSTGGGLPDGRSGNLLRQAYLLTGDAKQAERLAERALAASTLHTRRAGPAGADEHARSELVQLFVADAAPGGHAYGPMPVSGGQVAVWEALGGLPARRRAAVVLRYDEDLTDDEIAARLGGTPRSVLADIEAGLLTLRTALHGERDPGRVVSDALAAAGSRWVAWSNGDEVPAARPDPLVGGARQSIGGWGDPGPWGDGGPWGNPGSWDTAAGAHASGHSGPFPSGGASPQVSTAVRGDGAHQSGGADGATGSPGALPRRGATVATGDSAAPGALPRRGSPAPQRAAAGGHAEGATGSVGGRPLRGGNAPHGNGNGNGNSDLDRTTGRFGGPPRRASSTPPGSGAPLGIAAFPLDTEPQHRRFRTPTVIAAAALTTLVLGAVAVAVPALLNDADSPGAPTATSAVASEGETTAASQVPSRSVPKGLLDWPGRGPKAGDEKVLAAATAAWKAKAKGAETPTTEVSLLYAGSLDGRDVAILQALDRSGRPRLAQVSGAGTDRLGLVHSEPLMMAESAVLSILPATGPGGAIRVLVSPEGQAADGLLASDPMSGMPLKKIPLDDDGVSQVLPSPPGVPTCSRVVVMGLPGPLGRTGPRVLESGVVAANMLEGMPMEVEVGSSTLAPADDATPETQWFADGALLAKKLGKKGIVVAALGPRIATQAMSGSDRRMINSRAYEIRKGKERYIGSVVSLDGKTICTTVMPVRSTGVQSPLSAFVLRCPVMGTPAGILHVVGGADVQSVQVSLAPTTQPPGQQPYGNSVDRPAGSSATSSFAVLDVVAAGFPCGAGTVQATGGASSAPPTMLPVFTP